MSKERGDKPSHQGVEGGTSAIQCKSRFEGGRATLSDIAELLAEASCGMSEEEAKRKDQALPEAYRTEAAFLNGVLTSLRQGHSQMLPNQLKFDTTVKSFTRYLIHKAECEMWPIEGEGGAPQSPPQRHGYLFVETVIDHYTKTRGSQHARFVEALRVALTPTVDAVRPKSALSEAEPSRSLPTSVMAAAFSFRLGLKDALSEADGHHRWLLPARVHKAPRPKPQLWCPLKLAEVLMSRGASEHELHRAFMTEDALKIWRHEWQESRRERNAFGQ
jgi:hypothetical protein